MMFDRRLMYVAPLLFSCTLVGLTAARLLYTLHLPSADPLNDGSPFYDKIVAELFATSVLTFLWSAYAIHTTLPSGRQGFVRADSELQVLCCLCIPYLIGAAISTHFWGNLSFCWGHHACRLLTVLVAFSWINWAIIFALAMTIAIPLAMFAHAIANGGC